jgi:hypothetical protein
MKSEAPSRLCADESQRVHKEAVAQGMNRARTPRTNRYSEIAQLTTDDATKPFSDQSLEAIEQRGGTVEKRRRYADRFVAMGLSDCDGAAMIDVIGSLARETSKTSIPKRGQEQTTMESPRDPSQQDRTRHL